MDLICDFSHTMYRLAPLAPLRSRMLEEEVVEVMAEWLVEKDSFRKSLGLLTPPRSYSWWSCCRFLWLEAEESEAMVLNLPFPVCSEPK